MAGNRVITACYTGDIGHFDEDGFVFITDRKKDVVFVKGFNVFLFAIACCCSLKHINWENVTVHSTENVHKF